MPVRRRGDTGDAQDRPDHALPDRHGRRVVCRAWQARGGSTIWGHADMGECRNKRRHRCAVRLYRHEQEQLPVLPAESITMIFARFFSVFKPSLSYEDKISASVLPPGYRVLSNGKSFKWTSPRGHTSIFEETTYQRAVHMAMLNDESHRQDDWKDVTK